MRCIIVVALQEIKKSVRKCKLAPQKTELVFVHLLCSQKQLVFDYNCNVRGPLCSTVDVRFLYARLVLCFVM